MAQLYTINNNYPNTYFAFELNAQKMHMSPKIHQHSISEITALEDSLNQKSDVGHTHNNVRNLYSTIEIPREHKVCINTTENNIPKSDIALVNTAENQIILSYTSAQTGIHQWVNNSNKNSDRTMIAITDSTDYSTSNKTIEILHFKENRHA